MFKENLWTEYISLIFVLIIAVDVFKEILIYNTFVPEDREIYSSSQHAKKEDTVGILEKPKNQTKQSKVGGYATCMNTNIDKDTICRNMEVSKRYTLYVDTMHI